MFTVFAWLLAAWACVFYRFVPASLVSVATIEVGDVVRDPALESFRIFAHYFAYTVPVNVVEGGAENLVSSAENFTGSPVLVNGGLDG